MPGRRRYQRPKCPKCQTTRDIRYRITVPGGVAMDLCWYCKGGFEGVPGVKIEHIDP